MLWYSISSPSWPLLSPPLSPAFTADLLEHKGWELVADEQARADEVVKSMADSIYFFEEKRPKTVDAEAKAWK